MGGIDKVLAMVYDVSAMARYDSMRKLKRNEMLREYQKQHPELSFKEIGEAFNISESRAWRIINGNKKKVIESNTKGLVEVN